MGEVYRADDLLLPAQVALKFLPPSVAPDAHRLEQLRRELRMAREVTHKHVCRLYDLGEANGQQFLTMEYVAGADLMSSLRSHGRFPKEKALEIARELCAGLIALHEKGVLHRDLKPANVMLDSFGHVRITDFGVASAIGDSDSGLVGTLPYMAPEQLSGEPASIQSDIYALGLVLHEIFTGQKAHQATTRESLLALRESQLTTPPSSLVHDLNPQIDRVILWCLEPDATKRPESVLALAAALPGGLLETPLPRTVANSVGDEALRRSIASALLACVAIGLFFAGWAETRTSIVGRFAADFPPEVLAFEARKVLAHLGYDEVARDNASGFLYNTRYLLYTQLAHNPAARWRQLQAGRPPAITFWYRDSPRPLVVTSNTGVHFDDPPANTDGMRRVSLDPRGRLVAFQVVRPAYDALTGPAVTDWGPVLAAANLDPARFTTAAAMWTPSLPFDTRIAWTGTFAEQPDLPVRVEAAAYRGKLVAMEIFGPWNPIESAQGASGTSREDATSVLVLNLIFVVIIIWAVWGAWTNTRAGHGDRRGAFRAAAVVFPIRMVDWATSGHHPVVMGEVDLFWRVVSEALMVSATIGCLYLALEPYVRRHRYEVLVGWARMLDGRFRDPLVTGQILVGVVSAVLFSACVSAASWLDSQISTRISLDGVLSFMPVLNLFAKQVSESIPDGLEFCFLFLALGATLRNKWAGGAVTIILSAFWQAGVLGLFSLPGLAIGVAAGLVLVYLLLRWGLVGVVTFLFASNALLEAPLTLSPSAWFFGMSLYIIFAVAGMALYAAWFSTGPHALGIASKDQYLAKA